MALLYESKSVSPHPRPKKILILGLCRTGTSSLYAAQKELGMKPYHFRDIVFNTEHMKLWTRAVKAKFDGIGKPFVGEDFDQMLGEYDSVSDTPSCFFVEELLAAYPESKVILTVRSSESWLRSMQNTLITVVSWRSWTLLSFFDSAYSAIYWPLFNRIMRVMSKGNDPWKPSAFPSFLEYFDEHYALVRRMVPKDRLLEWHPSQGWGPVCEFLELPVPEKEFPHICTGDSNVRTHNSLYWKRWRQVALKGIKATSLISVTLGGIWYIRTGRMAGKAFPAAIASIVRGTST